MYIVLVFVLGAAFCAGWYLDNEIPGGFGAFWWLGLVVAWFIVVLSPALRQARYRVLMVSVAAIVLGIIILFYDATMGTYLSGVVLLLMLLLARHLGGGAGGRAPTWAALAIALSLTWMPIPLNQVTIKLPNLSAGTYLSLYATPDREPLQDGRFFNRLDDHQELLVGLGTQIWLDYPFPAPLLRVDILREKIVIRIMAISYESRIAYLDLPLLSVEGEALMGLKDSGLGAAFGTQMEKGRLMIDRLQVDNPAWIELPDLDNQQVSLKNRIVVILVRVLVWLIVAAGLLLWSPFLMRRRA